MGPTVPTDQLQYWEKLSGLENQVTIHTGAIEALQRNEREHQSTLDWMRGAWWAVAGAIAAAAAIGGAIINGLIALFGRGAAEWATNRMRDRIRPRIL